MFQRKKNILICVSLCLIFFVFKVQAQKDSIKYTLNLTSVASKGKYAPFWFQSNQYGTVSSKCFSTQMLASVFKDYSSNRNKFDYAFKITALGGVDQSGTSLYLHEYYAKVRWQFITGVVGAREEFYGTQDSTLSSGNIMFSQNARPLPQLFVGIEQFVFVPYSFRRLEIKGGISNGWFTDNVYTKNGMMHHKYAYARLGGDFPVRLQYGFEHVVQWGGSTPDMGKLPSSLSDFVKIFQGKGGGTGGEAINALGNHIIEQSLQMDIRVAEYRLSGYWQCFIEDGPVRIIGRTMNAVDGLWGISLKTEKFQFLKGICYEYLNTTDQSGTFHDKDGLIYGGLDSYFENGVYQNGWNHYLRTMGTPLISSPIYNTNGVIYTQNNRVFAHHFGAEGTIGGYDYRSLFTFTKNYGNYDHPITPTRNTSMLVEISKNFPSLKSIRVSASFGADFGKLYGNNSGFMIRISKTGDLLNYSRSK